MNRYIYHSVLVLVAALAAACSASEDMIGNEGNGSGQTTAPFALLGTSGSGVLNTEASYGEYTAYINVPGKWSVTTSKGLANIYPSSGEGPVTALVQVGENWGAARENVLTLKTENTGRRAAGDGESKVTILQSNNPSMDSVSTVFSSVKGAGYSYMPGGEYCDGALIQLFNLVTLDSIQRKTGVSLITDVIFPETIQEVITADSEEAIKKGLEVKASLGMNFGKIKNKGTGSGSIGVDVGKLNEKKSKSKYALKRVKTTQFTREIEYMSVMALLAKATTREEKQKLLSPGFFSIQETFAKEVAAAKGDDRKQRVLCDRFLSEVGPCFISKSAMGAVLDYQISVDSTALRDTLGVGVALQASFQGTVKGKDVGGTISAGVTVTKDITEVLSKTTATVKVRGGDVSQVNVLVTGGWLYDSEVTAWQNSCSPTRAVMVDIALIPIYTLIADDYARQVMMDYFYAKLQ